MNEIKMWIRNDMSSDEVNGKSVWTDNGVDLKCPYKLTKLISTLNEWIYVLVNYMKVVNTFGKQRDGHPGIALYTFTVTLKIRTIKNTYNLDIRPKRQNIIKTLMQSRKFKCEMMCHLRQQRETL